MRRALLGVGLCALSLLAGWLIGGGSNSVSAQIAPPPPPTVCFEIPGGVLANGRPVLLNRCTGDSWRFDNGLMHWDRIGRDP